MAKAPNQKWYKIAEQIDNINFRANSLAELEVNGKKICIAKFKNQFFGCTQKCPHAGGILAEGYVDTIGNIVCPLHRYKFDLKNGKNISGEGYNLITFKVEERENGVFICLDDNTDLR